MPADWSLCIAIASVVVLLLGVGVWYSIFLSYPYVNVLQTASEDYQVAFDAYTKLRRIPGFGSKADELLAEFWDRRARLAESRENRDEALILWLKALSSHPIDTRRSEVGMLTGNDYEDLLMTFRHSANVSDIAFSPDGKTLLTGSDNRTARLWSADTGQLIGESLLRPGSIRAFAFGLDGKTVILLTRLWAHQLTIEGDRLVYNASRLLKGKQTGAYHFLDDSGNRLQIVSYVTGDSLRIDTVQFGIIDAPPMPSDPNSLLEEWQRKLSLKFDEQGKIVPVWPVESLSGLERTR